MVLRSTARTKTAPAARKGGGTRSDHGRYVQSFVVAAANGGGDEQPYGPLVTEQAMTVVEILLKEHTRALTDAIPVLQQVRPQ